jgi:hypothetical protein
VRSTGHVSKLNWDSLRIRSAAILFVGAGCASLMFVIGADSTAAQNANELRPPSAFSNIQDPQLRSRALFTEAAKVIMNPRCVNCHPATEHPLQGNDQHIHMPPAIRGDNGDGIGGNTCGACHMELNVTLHEAASYQSVPGRPGWMLAPRAMAWEGKSMTEICEQLKDPARNSDRNLMLLYEHFLTSELIGWAWNPGLGRDPVPGTQQQLAELIKAWIDTGAVCP